MQDGFRNKVKKNQFYYFKIVKYPQGNSNPCYFREREMS